MSLKFNVGFWCIVGVQIVVLLAMIGFKETALRTGTEVVLQTVPVDPRSIFQGDYVILRYAIGVPGRNGSLPWDRRNENRPEQGTAVFVTLRQSGDVWKAASYDFNRDEAGLVAIRGEIDEGGILDFGIGTYFVPEGTGRGIERAEDVKVRVVVGQDGKAVIKEVLVDGELFQPVREGTDSQQR